MKDETFKKTNTIDTEDVGETKSTLDKKFETELRKVEDVKSTIKIDKELDIESLGMVSKLLNKYKDLPMNRKNKRLVAHLLEVDKILRD